ncbi:endonuclease domain-containing 1 protein [Rousettus aegyptiacus]|uniref:Endonuclease domain containing 1 n=1 Tax=Rousettus aegyptiacus TaxID=9407 RepID=A0A7J8GZH8_ROUAE|nr:endonuclease domain-containing 1 protein [Rousettus aegyptiacus]KAF6464999.1 endonuclease domain containing 1 [Rousettus aegyptiacus]
MGPACWLALSSLLALGALLEGRLVGEGDAGFGECDQFFYAETPPAGLVAEGHVKICQRSEGAQRFATLYSTRDRIPVYSAFRAPRLAPGGTEQRWLVEPQIDDPDSKLEEAINEADAITSVNNLGSRQALNTDYLDSDYQGGQLYPFSLSNDFHMATFTLTNAVPMTPSFRERWYMNLNSLMDQALTPQCGGGDDLYILTGAVPSDHNVKDKVTIPEFVWLAACCAVPGGGWAMGFVKHTRDGDVIEDVMVKELEKLLPFNPQLFQNNCGEKEQDTEKMKKILEMVNQVQDEERTVRSKETSSPLSSTRSKKSALLPPEASEERSSFLGKLIGFIATPFIKLFQLICYLMIGILKNIVYFLWYVTKQVINGIESCLYRLGLATISYFLAIGEELASIPWKVLKVIVKIIRAILRILCCLLKVLCRILGIPVRVLVDVATFPVYTMGAVPVVCKDIAMGLGGTISLLFDTAFGTMGGLFQVIFSVCKRIGYRVTFDNSGDL